MPKQRAFEARDWACVLAAMLQALLWVVVFWPEDMLAATDMPGLSALGEFGVACLPGVGFTVVALVGFGAALLVLGRRARLDRVTIPLLIACAMLAIVPAICGNGDVRRLNALVLWAVGTLTLYLVADVRPACRVTLRSWGASVALFFKSQFAHLVRPVRAAAAWVGSLRAEDGEGRRLPQGVIAGVVAACALVVLVVVPLLSSADAVFGSFTEDFLDGLARLSLDDDAFARVAMFLIFTPVLFGLLWGFTRAPRPEPAADREASRAVPAATAIIVLAALVAVYALFIGVQAVYLFGGAQSAAMHGGYAEYARSGFFELVAVAAVNLAVGLVAATALRPARAADTGEGEGAPVPLGRTPRVAIQALICLLALASFVILASAAWRMEFYVLEFGLSLLRALTLLGMAFIAVMLAVLMAKAFRPEMPVFRVALAAGLALWIAFCLVDVDARIAGINANRYIDGTLEHLDTRYLWELSPSADASIERLDAFLADAEGRPADDPDRIALHDRLDASAKAREDLPWQMQCLAYWV